MVERIRVLLETRQLTPTQFADAIGIARPIVSHILSGRNKPSLDVVQRILAAMPDLSMPWLLNGTGPMQAGTPAIPTEISSQNLHQLPDNELLIEQQGASLVDEGPVPLPITSPSQQSTPAPKTELSPGSNSSNISPKRTVIKRFAPILPVLIPVLAAVPTEGLPPAIAVAPSMPSSGVSHTPESGAAPEANTASSNDAASAAALFAGTEKPIRRIVIFYRDGSFADYQPES